MAEVELRLDGPDHAACTLLLAHGAGAGMDSPFLLALAQGFAAAGIRVARFEFPYMAARRQGRRPPPDRLPALLQACRDARAALGPCPSLAVGGKSLGGRVATLVADELQASACVVFGYPFHPAKQPEVLRTAHLAALRTKTLLLQGERDAFGSRAEVAGYALASSIAVHWAQDGDHSLQPRQSSGHTAAANFAAAMAAAIAFLQRHCCGRRG